MMSTAPAQLAPIFAAALWGISTAAVAQVPAASSYDPVQAGEVPPGYY